MGVGQVLFKKKKFLIFLCAGLIFPFAIFASEITFKITPGAMMPFLSADNYYSPVGFNAFVETGVNVNKFMNVGAAFGFFLMPKSNYKELQEGIPQNIMYVPFGARLEFFGYPGSRIELAGGVALGVGLGINGANTMYAPWYKAYGDVMFRVNPNFSLGLNVSWVDYQSESYWGKPGMAGISAGISAKFKLETEKMVHKVKVSIDQYDRVFPLLKSLYKDNEFGAILIENNESAEIRNVKVYFRSADFTASELFCGEVNRIYKKEVAEVPLVADFNNRIMQFSESGEIPCEVVVEYEMLGKKRSTVESVIVSVYNRNQLRWTDPAVLSAYISTTSQEVLEFSKYLVGIARNQLRSGLSQKLQFAMYLYEGIRLNGIECKADNATPYSVYHMDDELLDYIQYPFQSLIYKSGDVDDIGVLFMAMLQSVGIDAAYIPLENDFIVLIDVNQSAAKVSSMLDGLDRAIVLYDQIWIPVSMSTLREGFVNSWYNAVVEIAEAEANGEDVMFYLLSEGWQTYPPAAFSSGSNVSDKPLEALLIGAVETNMARYITSEFGPQIAALQYQIKQNGMSADLLNKLGLLYVRAGMYSSAIPVYERAASMGSVSAMNNLGNIAVLQSKYAEAKLWYERALSVDPRNSTALSGLNRVLGHLED